MNLTSNLEELVIQFGKMRIHWGFNRTVGRMLALIVLSDLPQSAERIGKYQYGSERIK